MWSSAFAAPRWLVIHCLDFVLVLARFHWFACTSAPNRCSHIACSACVRAPMHFPSFLVISQNPASTPASLRILDRLTMSPSTTMCSRIGMHDHEIN
jgi:hypothetical protein